MGHVWPLITKVRPYSMSLQCCGVEFSFGKLPLLFSPNFQTQEVPVQTAYIYNASLSASESLRSIFIFSFVGCFRYELWSNQNITTTTKGKWDLTKTDQQQRSNSLQLLYYCLRLWNNRASEGTEGWRFCGWSELVISLGVDFLVIATATESPFKWPRVCTRAQQGHAVQ